MTQSQSYDPRAEAERLLDRICAAMDDSTAALVATRDAITAAFAAGASSRDAEVQARDIAHALGFREGTTHGIGLGRAAARAEAIEDAARLFDDDAVTMQNENDRDEYRAIANDIRALLTPDASGKGAG